MKINHTKNKIIGIFAGCCLIFGVFFALANISYAIDTYQPLENITIGEFIYNDDYTPTADNCTISIYNPVTLVAEVDNATMTDEGTVAVTGWHYYNWTTLATEGKYPATITCGPDPDGNILKLDKSFIVKAPVVTNSSIASAVDVNTSSHVSAAVTSINAHSDTNTSSLPASIWGYTSRTLSSFGTLVSDIATAVWGSTTRSLTTFGTLVADVWTNSTRTLTSLGGTSEADIAAIKAKTDTIAWGDVTGLGTSNALIKAKTDTINWSDVTNIKAKTDTINWTDVTATRDNVITILAETGNIAGIKTKTDTINWSDVTGLFTSNGQIKAKTDTINWSDVTGIKTKTDTIAWADVTGIKTNTDTINWTDITTIKNNAATLIAEIGTGNISAIKTKTDTINWSDVTGLFTSNGQIKAKTDTINWSDVTGIKTKTDTIAWSDVTGIKTKTDTILWSDIANLATGAQLASAVSPLATSANVTSSANAITSAISALNNITAADVWSSPNRSLTTFGTLVADVWNNWTRTLTGGGGQGNGSLTAADIWAYSQRTLTSLTLSSQTPWAITTSDFGTITAGQNYLATVYVLYNGNLTDPMNSPTVIIYDPSRNVVVNGASMIKTPNTVGTFTYSYTTAGNAPGGVWETDFSVPVAPGNTLPGSDYWNVSTAPPQVVITSMNSTVVPNISANVRITNEGTVPYEYQYEWCIVSSLNNPCGGGDDIFYSSAAKLIDPGDNFDTILSGTVTTPGNYYFKVAVFYGTEKSGASRSFVATSTGTSTGGGGGSGGGLPPPIVVTGTCSGADFNHDKKVNSIDFSILLAFWKTNPPFLNPCVDINKDLKVNSVDFSILLSQWGSTGTILNLNQ